jgi:16S rRNA (uracil1498-N3)-methyltransferase
MPLHKAVECFSTDGGLKLLLYEKENEMRLKDVLTAVTAGNAGGKVVLACGPEGGFTEEEVLFARSRDFVPVRLGGRILRCETAALAALSIIQYELGDL